jgi:hypothetical protein
MQQVLENIDASIDDVVRRPAPDVTDESYAAGVCLPARVVEALGLR